MILKSEYTLCMLNILGQVKNLGKCNKYIFVLYSMVKSFGVDVMPEAPEEIEQLPLDVLGSLATLASGSQLPLSSLNPIIGGATPTEA